MTGLQNTLALILVVIAFVLMILFTFLKPLQGRITLRPMAAFRRLRRALGLAAEDGKRVHVTLGKSSLLGVEGATALVGLAVLERIAQLSVISDRPPTVTSGDGALSLLSQDTLRAAYRTSNALEQYDSDQARLTGTQPMAYVVGTLPVIHDEQVATTVLLGNFGPEAAFLCEASDQERSFTLAASDSLPAQAVFYATAEEPLIGEELFAVPAYLQAGPAHMASLRVQDILRWVVIGGLLVTAVLKLANEMFGARF